MGQLYTGLYLPLEEKYHILSGMFSAKYLIFIIQSINVIRNKSADILQMLNT
jgi:hypothetical protein